MSKMTDKDIIKALECCISDENCENCPLHHKKIENACVLTVVEFYKEILDLINRQQAEIERLQEVQVQYVKAYFDEFVERLKFDISLTELDSGLLDYVIDELVETMKNEFSREADFTDLIKAEAIKEFAERLKTLMFGKYCDYFNFEITNAIIDNIVKEMVGDAGTSKRYVKCDGCGNDIYLGEIAFQYDGLCGIYCSPECFSDAFATTRVITEEEAENCGSEVFEEMVGEENDRV